MAKVERALLRSLALLVIPVAAALLLVGLLIANRTSWSAQEIRHRSDLAEQCDSALAEASRALESGLFETALARLESNRKCDGELEFDAARAEALAFLDRVLEAESLVSSVLARSPHQPSGLRARAASSISRRQFQIAEASIRELDQVHPKHVSTLYLKALTAMRRAQYNAARTGFLGVLRANRRHVGARFALVVLTSQSGVSDEARHHLRELLEIAPADDPRRAQAERLIDAPVVSPNSRVLKLGSD
ncbi:MAG TPA: hypothetical protein VFQ61_11655 [Polyangiaceae bacterium]|nr:hypothetical protein [Polyangiaceae bacterium]